MLSTPPKTGNATLDTFLQEIYQKSLELEEKTIPEEGWSLTDLRSDLSEVISDKRDLIDIVTKYDDLKVYSEAISAQKEYLDSVLAETRKISEHSQWFAEIMEWWDQNYKIIQDAKSAMASATDAAGYAAAAKTSETNAKASEAAAATSAAKAKTSETNAGTKATQASTSATNAKTSETNAKASEAAAKGSAEAAAASATKTGQDVVKTAANQEVLENAVTAAAESATTAEGHATAADASRVSAATSATNAASAAAAEVEKLKAGAPAAFDTLLEIANELAANETERSALTNSIAAKADKVHDHTVEQVTGLQGELDGKAPASHTHDDRYYTKGQSDGRYVGMSGTSTKTGDLNMDGGSVGYIRPNTTGGWARGLWWKDRDNSYLAGIGVFGNASVVNYFYLGHGESPWSNPVFRAYKDRVIITDLEVTGKVTGIEADDVGAAPASHDHTAAQISDATATGRSVLTAASQSAARSAIGAGTSNLALGTTASTAAAGDHSHTAADVGAAPADHTHTPESIGAAPADHTHSQYATTAHTHTPASIGAAPADHSHPEYATTAQVTARTPEIREVTSLPSSPVAGVVYLVTG